MNFPLVTWKFCMRQALTLAHFASANLRLCFALTNRKLLFCHVFFLSCCYSPALNDQNYWKYFNLVLMFSISAYLMAVTVSMHFDWMHFFFQTRVVSIDPTWSRAASVPVWAWTLVWRGSRWSFQRHVHCACLDCCPSSLFPPRRPSRSRTRLWRLPRATMSASTPLPHSNTCCLNWTAVWRTSTCSRCLI